jgi:hypothetical protein
VYIKEIEKRNYSTNDKGYVNVFWYWKKYVSNKIMEVNAVVNRRNYQIKVWKSTIEYDELMEVVFVVFTVLLVFYF